MSGVFYNNVFYQPPERAHYSSYIIKFNQYQNALRYQFNEFALHLTVLDRLVAKQCTTPGCSLQFLIAILMKLLHCIHEILSF